MGQRDLTVAFICDREFVHVQFNEYPYANYRRHGLAFGSPML